MRLFIVLCFLVCSEVLFSQTPAWQRVNPLPFGETVVEIQKIPGTNRLIAACEYSSVLISDNGGETWQTIMYPANLKGDFKVVGLYFLNNTTGFLYGEGPVILKTTDAGLTWHICNLPAGWYSDLYAMVFSDEHYGFVIGEFGTILKTYDTGENWQEIDIFGFDYDFTSIDFRSSNDGFITGHEVFTSGFGIIKTYDQGETWNLESTLEGIEGEINNIHFITSLIGFASANARIYRTTDGGVHWQEVFYDNTRYSRFYFEFYNSLKGIAFYISEYYPSAFFLTSDGGLTWQPVSQSGENACCNDLVYYDENTLFSAGDNGCLFKSADGGHTWEKISQKSISGAIQEVKLIDENTGIFVDWYQNPDMTSGYKIVKSNDGFNTFDTLLVREYSYFPLMIDFPDQDTGYVVSGNPNIDLLLISRTTNSGVTWIIDTLDYSNFGRHIDFYDGKKGIISFFLNPSLLLTSNGGNSWQEKIFADDVRIQGACYVSASKIIVSATDQSGPVLLKSEDNGETWSMIIETIPESGELYFLDEMAGFIIADTLAYKTSDGGYNWTRCSINVPGFRIYDITFPSQNIGYIVGKSDYENVLKTTDGGLTWNPIHAPDVFPYSNVEFTDNETGYIFSGNIIHKTTTGGILGEEPHFPVAQKFHAYPNPFQSGIRIEVSDREIHTAYQMNVFSLNGVQLYSTTIQPQTTSIWFQGSMLPPGTYLFQFRSEKEVIETIKVIKVGSSGF